MEPEVVSPSAEEPEFVYVMAAESGAVKIGYSRQPSKRLREIQNGWVPDSVDRSDLRIRYLVDGSRDLERELHAHFRQQRVTGEWFNLGPPAAAVMHVTDVVRRYALKRGMADPQPVQLPEQAPAAKSLSSADWNAYLDSRRPGGSDDGPETGPDAPPRFAAAAAQHREYFQAWISAGFSEQQAIQLVAALVARDGGW